MACPQRNGGTAHVCAMPVAIIARYICAACASRIRIEIFFKGLSRSSSTQAVAHLAGARSRPWTLNIVALGPFSCAASQNTTARRADLHVCIAGQGTSRCN